MFGVDAARTGHNPDERGPTGSAGVAWERTLDGEPVTAPAVVDDAVFVGTRGGGVYALDAKSGETEWSRRLPEGQVSWGVTPPAVGDGSVFVGSNGPGYGGSLHALDVGDGSTNWTLDLFVPSPPAVVEGEVLVAFRGDATGVAAVDAVAGEERWRCETVDGAGGPAVAGGTVCIGGPGGFVYAVDRSTGRETWRFDSNQYQPTTWAADDTPVVAGDRVYASNENFLLSLDGASGSDRWHRGLVMLSESPALYDGSLFLVGSDADNQEVLYAVDASTGNDRWRYEPELVYGDGGTAPTVAGSTVYAGVGKAVVGVASDTGESVWQYETREPVGGSPAVVDGTVYVGDRGGTLYALR
jgi:outer membrane protein assembly factor BamB